MSVPGYLDLPPTLIDRDDDVVYVNVNLRSLSAIVELPNAYISAVGDEYEND